jgi:hypothetical protein
VPEALKTVELCLAAIQQDDGVPVLEALKTAELCFDALEYVPEVLKTQVKKAAGIA